MSLVEQTRAAVLSQVGKDIPVGQDALRTLGINPLVCESIRFEGDESNVFLSDVRLKTHGLKYLGIMSGTGKPCVSSRPLLSLPNVLCPLSCVLCPVSCVGVAIDAFSEDSGQTFCSDPPEDPEYEISVNGFVQRGLARAAWDQYTSGHDVFPLARTIVAAGFIRRTRVYHKLLQAPRSLNAPLFMNELASGVPSCKFIDFKTCLGLTLLIPSFAETCPFHFDGVNLVLKPEAHGCLEEILYSAHVIMFSDDAPSVYYGGAYDRTKYADLAWYKKHCDILENPMVAVSDAFDVDSSVSATDVVYKLCPDSTLVKPFAKVIEFADAKVDECLKGDVVCTKLVIDSMLETFGQEIYTEGWSMVVTDVHRELDYAKDLSELFSQVNFTVYSDTHVHGIPLQDLIAHDVKQGMRKLSEDLPEGRSALTGLPEGRSALTGLPNADDGLPSDTLTLDPSPSMVDAAQTMMTFLPAEASANPDDFDADDLREVVEEELGIDLYKDIGHLLEDPVSASMEVEIPTEIEVPKAYDTTVQDTTVLDTILGLFNRIERQPGILRKLKKRKRDDDEGLRSFEGLRSLQSNVCPSPEPYHVRNEEEHLQIYQDHCARVPPWVHETPIPAKFHDLFTELDNYSLSRLGHPLMNDEGMGTILILPTLYCLSDYTKFDFWPEEKKCVDHLKHHLADFPPSLIDEFVVYVADWLYNAHDANLGMINMKSNTRKVHHPGMYGGKNGKRIRKDVTSVHEKTHEFIRMSLMAFYEILPYYEENPKRHEICYDGPKAWNKLGYWYAGAFSKSNFAYKAKARPKTLKEGEDYFGGAEKVFQRLRNGDYPRPHPRGRTFVLNFDDGRQRFPMNLQTRLVSQSGYEYKTPLLVRVINTMSKTIYNDETVEKQKRGLLRCGNEQEHDGVLITARPLGPFGLSSQEVFEA